MPGLAASELIFEQLEFPNQAYELHFLKWIMPEKKESIQSYCQRLSAQITHQNIVLVGVSFGGLIVQELSLILNVKLTVIVSSISSERDLPKRIKFLKYSKIIHIIPSRVYSDVDKLIRFTLGEKSKKHKELYRKYLSFNNPTYLSWAFKTILNWENRNTISPLIHIHGSKDSVFPIKHIKTKGLITVESGTHIMIMKRYKWFNENLPKLITQHSL